jgi:transposase
VRWAQPRGDWQEEAWLRVVEGRPVRAITTQWRHWGTDLRERAGKTALRLIWDNASWHSSHAVDAWLQAHKRTVKQAGTGVRIVVCALPVTRPWLNPIEPTWGHGKRTVIEPARLLTAQEVQDRVCAAFDGPHDAHLVVPEYAA